MNNILSRQDAGIFHAEYTVAIDRLQTQFMLNILLL